MNALRNINALRNMSKLSNHLKMARNHIINNKPYITNPYSGKSLAANTTNDTIDRENMDTSDRIERENMIMKDILNNFFPY